MRCCVSAFLVCWALSAQAESPVKDLTLAFDDFYTRTAQLPTAERVAEFRRTVGAQFPQFYGDEVAWRRLWSEGLATYVSHVMHPQASSKELLLDFPDGTVTRTRAALPAAWDQLEQVLDSKDPAVNASLFEMGGKHAVLPPRRGYHLGYLVAQDAAREHSLADLAALGCEPARELVTATVRKLRAASR